MIKQLLPALAWSLIILLLYGVPGSDIPRMDLMSLLSMDKLAHAGFFAMQVHLLITAFRKQTRSPICKYNAIRLSIAISAGYGIVLELIQGAVFSERTTDWLDLLANLVGCGLGFLLFRLVYGKDLTFISRS
jgi:VanZ family protein